MCLAGRKYDRLASVYDLVFGRSLHAGRVEAMERLPIRHGDHVLDVGIGTGLTATLYPKYCSVTGIDMSGPMLDRAARRLRVAHVENVRLLRMDAAHLRFPDESFSLIYAAYVLTAVPDPVQVAREMSRVCQLGGHVVILNHFRSDGPVLATLERMLSPIALRVGFRTDLDLGALLVDAGLTPVAVHKVNTPSLWSLVICRKLRSEPGSRRVA